MPSTVCVRARSIFSPVEASWSSREMASRIAPVDWRAISVSASSFTLIFSFFAISFKQATISATGMRRNSWRWQRESTVAGYLVDFGGRQDKDGVGGRFFQGLQQGVEGRCGEHVDFVDDVDLDIRPGWERS